MNPRPIEDTEMCFTLRAFLLPSIQSYQLFESRSHIFNALVPEPEAVWLPEFVPPSVEVGASKSYRYVISTQTLDQHMKQASTGRDLLPD